MNANHVDAALKALAWQDWQYKLDSDSYFHRKDCHNSRDVAFANILPEGTGLLLSIVYGYRAYKLDPPDPLHIPTDMPAAEVFLAVMKVLIEIENQVSQNDP